MRDKKYRESRVEGSSPVRELFFFAEFICSNTILAKMPECSTLEKPRLCILPAVFVISSGPALECSVRAHTLGY